MNKVNYYQSGHIIGIVRDKNGFIEYVQDGVQYADIKLNVLIKGKHNNIIGEIQFLLQVDLIYVLPIFHRKHLLQIEYDTILVIK